MRAERISKSIFAIIIAFAVIIVACATVCGCKKRNPSAPEASVTSVVGEPEYTFTLSWNAVDGADTYAVEYEYELYKGDIHSYETSACEATFTYMRGKINYRVRAYSVSGDVDSGFSAWMTYESEGLTLDALRSFNVDAVDGKYRVDVNTFEPINYTYKGETKTVNYYEFDLIPPDTEVEEHDPVVYSLSQITDGFDFNISDIEGVWHLYVRPANYVEINGEKDYSQVKELYELYREAGYIVIEITV